MIQGRINKNIECPNCGAKSTGYSSVDPGADFPKCGDVAVCLYCKAVNMYCEDMSLIEAPESVVAEVSLILRRSKSELKDSDRPTN